MLDALVIDEMSDQPPPEQEKEPQVPTKTAGILNAAKEDLEDKKIVAFLGDTDSGKTVAATLFKDAMFTHFLPKYEDKFAATLVNGYDVLSAAESKMFAGRFPDPTPEETTYEIEFEVENKDVLGSKSELRIRDIDGEDYSELILGPDLEPKTRIREMLTRYRGSKTYGPMSYFIFAKIYILLIDCELYRKWKMLDLRQAQTIYSILQFKEAIEEVKDGKISIPIAIMLTKADQLPKDATGTPEELIKQNMPQFYHTLKNKNVGVIEFFKSNVDLEESSITPNQDPSDVTPNQDPSDVTPKPEKPHIKQPLSYSSDEYVRLILWIIKNIK